MSKLGEIFEGVRIEDLERQVAHLTQQLRDYQTVKEQLAQAQKRETLASLSGGIAHDFNNILHCILGYTEKGLSEKKNGSYDSNILKQIQVIVEKGRDLAQRFLVYGRGTTQHRVSLNFNSIIEEVEILLSRTMPRNISIEQKLDSNLSPITADAGQCEQILMNLCLNAMDAMPRGGRLTIKTENIEFDDNCPLHMRLGISPGSYIHISVSDTGIGMSKETINSIFEPFFTTKEKGRGSGLGLSVVSTIVKNHGGYVYCASIPGSGSTFDLYLPSVNSDYVEKKPDDESHFPGNPMGGEAILFVDDEEAIIELGKHFLESNGYNVFTSYDCEKGLEIYTNHSVDFVIMDVGLPGMGSANFLQKLQSLNPEVKVLAISGYSSSNRSVKALGLDEEDFIQKPFAWDQLMTRMRAILDSNVTDYHQNVLSEKSSIA